MKDGASRLAEGHEVSGADAVKFVDAQADLAGVSRILKIGQNGSEVGIVLKPDAVGDDLVETKTQLCRPAREGDDELRVEEGLPASEAEQLDALAMGVFKEAD